MHIAQKKRTKKSFFKDNELQSFSFFALYTRNDVEPACLTRQIRRLKEQGKLQENVVFALKRIFRWVSGLVVLAVVLARCGVEVGIIAGLLALARATIMGFAAMNTLGSAIES
jgi:hypothetical protein